MSIVSGRQGLFPVVCAMLRSDDESYWGISTHTIACLHNCMPWHARAAVCPGYLGFPHLAVINMMHVTYTTVCLPCLLYVLTILLGRVTLVQDGVCLMTILCATCSAAAPCFFNVRVYV